MDNNIKLIPKNNIFSIKNKAIFLSLAEMREVLFVLLSFVI